MVLDERQNEKYGGRAAARVFREIAAGALASLGVPSSAPGEAPLAATQEVGVAEGYITEAPPEDGDDLEVEGHAERSS